MTSTVSSQLVRSVLTVDSSRGVKIVSSLSLVMHSYAFLEPLEPDMQKHSNTDLHLYVKNFFSSNGRIRTAFTDSLKTIKDEDGDNPLAALTSIGLGAPAPSSNSDAKTNSNNESANRFSLAMAGALISLADVVGILVAKLVARNRTPARMEIVPEPLKMIMPPPPTDINPPTRVRAPSLDKNIASSNITSNNNKIDNKENRFEEEKIEEIPSKYESYSLEQTLPSKYDSKYDSYSLEQISEKNERTREAPRIYASKSDPATPVSGGSQTGESYTLNTLSEGRFEESSYEREEELDFEPDETPFHRSHDTPPPTRSAEKAARANKEQTLSSKKKMFSPFPSTPRRSYDNDEQQQPSSSSSYKKRSQAILTSNTDNTDEAHIPVALHQNQRDTDPINSRFSNTVKASPSPRAQKKTTRNDDNPISYKKQQASYFPTSNHGMSPNQHQRKMPPQQPIVSPSFYSQASHQTGSLIGIAIPTPRGNRLPMTSPAGGGSVYSQPLVVTGSIDKADKSPRSRNSQFHKQHFDDDEDNTIMEQYTGEFTQRTSEDEYTQTMLTEDFTQEEYTDGEYTMEEEFTVEDYTTEGEEDFTPTPKKDAPKSPWNKFFGGLGNKVAGSDKDSSEDYTTDAEYTTDYTTDAETIGTEYTDERDEKPKKQVKRRDHGRPEIERRDLYKGRRDEYNRKGDEDRNREARLTENRTRLAKIQDDRSRGGGSSQRQKESERKILQDDRSRGSQRQKTPERKSRAPLPKLNIRANDSELGHIGGESLEFISSDDSTSVEVLFTPKNTKSRQVEELFDDPPPTRKAVTPHVVEQRKNLNLKLSKKTKNQRDLAKARAERAVREAKKSQETREKPKPVNVNVNKPKGVLRNGGTPQRKKQNDDDLYVIQEDDYSI
mmetsp:Transcript_34446/g.45647  ORF Transcript_34446/g.45647 Transcript_34446/m.45647 type:complete len:893 (-) Transcript_34446:164-2842(-)